MVQIRPRRLLFGVLIILSLIPQAVIAEDTLSPAEETRAASIAEEQEEKSKVTKPPVPDKAEAIVRKVEGIFLNDPSGWYPYFASVYHGGGFTGGAAYRRYFGDNTFWDVRGLYSVLNYKLIEGSIESRDHAAKRLSFGTRLGWRDATQVAYYGLGIASKPEDRANFRFQETYLDGHMNFRPIRWISLKGAVGFEHWGTKEGKGDAPSIETIYTPETAPGLGASPSYLHSQVSTGIDWRPSPGYARRGGLYQVTFHDYRNNQGGTYSFQRLDGDVIQHLPILRETWVLSVRGRVQTTLNENALVPYFLLPSLGSGSTIRGYNSDRFRDLHSLLVSGEFRWIPNAWALDMALFYDAGKVTDRRSDLNFSRLKSDVGIGFRIHGPFSTPLRVDVAVGNEGWQLVISSAAPF